VKYALRLAYRGERYAGWQRQANALAVQAVVEEALAGLQGGKVTLVGASRTDAGVHARGQVAHLAWSSDGAESALVHGANHRLPEDIRVLDARAVPDEFHARFSALAKEYRYRLVRTAVLTPLDAPLAVRADDDLDVSALREATAALPGEHDFAAFTLAGGAQRTTRRKVHEARWLEHGERLVFRIVGDGFLRGMVRGLVGTLLEVGQRRRTPEDFAALLGGAPRGSAGPTAPARGLTLERVFYENDPWAEPAARRSR
jgi:tRNA pseudouridine38-40 synthase